VSFEQELGKKFARLTTNAVVRVPALWGLFRGPLRLQFERLAPIWSELPAAHAFAAYEAALEAVGSPRNALDLGTGTGTGARILARRFPDAEITGADLAARMVEEAERLTPPELAGRLRFVQADAAELPFRGGEFELVALANMIPFFGELARVTAPGGAVVIAFSFGCHTPIYVPFARLRAQLVRRGFEEFAEFSAERGTALVARKR
jgi:ubiquinone/menaquinone biosynthesis C-methylase UbiE